MTKDIVYLIDPPGPFDTLDTWEQFLTEMRSLPGPSMSRDRAIERAERMIAEIKNPDLVKHLTEEEALENIRAALKVLTTKPRSPSEDS